MALANVDFNNFSLDDDNFDDRNLEIYATFVAWCNR